MAGVSVTTESLHIVKNALSDFQKDIESYSHKISSSTEQILVEVKQSIKKQKDIVTTLENTVSSLIKEIEQIQTSIISTNTRISSLKTGMQNLDKQKSQIESQIFQLEQKKRQLEAQRNTSNGNDNGIETQIRAIEGQMQNYRRTLRQLNEQIAQERKQLAECEKLCAEQKSLKMEKEMVLAEEKNKLNKAKSKLDRLSSAGDSVEREIANLSSAAQRFEQTGSITTTTSKAGVSKCIAEIDEYLRTSLNSSGSHSSSGFSSLSHQPGNIRQILDSNAPAMRDRMLFELSVIRSDLELTEGNPALPQLGGSHREVRQQLQDLGLQGFQAHHIPSAAAQSAFPNQNREYWESLPTIAISNTDHLETDSYGGRQSRAYQSFLPDVPRSASYRNEITAEIENGNYIEVVRNELYNIRDRFGHDYDGGISRYLDFLESFLQNN